MKSPTFRGVVIGACHLGAAVCFAGSFYYLVVLASSYEHLLQGVGLFGGAAALEVVAALMKKGGRSGAEDE